MDLTPWVPSGVASVIFNFETKPKLAGGVKARIDVATAGEDASIVRSVTETDTAGVIGLRIPAKLKAEGAQVLSIREDAARRLEAIKALKLSDGPLPKRIWCMTGFRSNGQFYTDPAIAQMDFDCIRLLGMNAFWEQNGGQPQHLRAMAQAHGLDRSTVYWRDVESPPRAKSGRIALDWDALEKFIDNSYRRTIAGRGRHTEWHAGADRGFNGRGRRGNAFGGPEYQAAFREFVQRQGFAARFFREGRLGPS